MHGWSLNNEEAGSLLSLDKQMSDDFQRCSGDLVGSGGYNPGTLKTKQ